MENKTLIVHITRVPGSDPAVPLPSPQTDGSAGCDLAAANPEPITLAPGGRALIPTGIAIALPPNHEAQIRPRSGLAIKHGISLLNTPGTIDSDYRGEIKIIMINLGQQPFTITKGDRIAQMVVAATLPIKLKQVENLDSTDRGPGGFGHTGV